MRRASRIVGVGPTAALPNEGGILERRAESADPSKVLARALFSIPSTKEPRKI
jgi:hypothetical protein